MDEQQNVSFYRFGVHTGEYWDESVQKYYCDMMTENPEIFRKFFSIMNSGNEDYKEKKSSE